MTNMTDERLAEIEARCEALTPGIWKYDAPNTVETTVHTPEGMWGETILKAMCEDGYCATNLNLKKENAAFICSARQDTLDLLAEVKTLRAEKAQAEAERDVLLHELLKETHSHLCEDPERPCPFDEETEGKCCNNECANADPETCWRKYAQQQAEKKGA